MKQQKGYIALLAVLIMGAASTAIAVTLLFTGIDSQRGALVTMRSAQARNLASACAEEALQQIHEDTNYTGAGNLSMGQGSCTYTVTNVSGSDRAIAITGTVNSVVRKVQLYVTIGASSISVTSWQEVS